MVQKDQEIISEGVDWLHMHSSGDCIDIYKKEYPEDYKKTCEYFKVNTDTMRENVFNFLDALRESGAVNMLGASANVNAEFKGLGKTESRRLTLDWMRGFKN